MITARVLNSLLVVIFAAWLLPLGLFVKKINQKEFCNGQRPICLCTHLLTSAPVKPSGEITFQSGGAHKNQEGAYSSPNMLVSIFYQPQDLCGGGFISQETFSYRFSFLPAIEHVPKA